MASFGAQNNPRQGYYFHLQRGETEAREWNKGTMCPRSHGWSGRTLGFKPSQTPHPSPPRAGRGLCPHSPHPHPSHPLPLSWGCHNQTPRTGGLMPQSLIPHSPGGWTSEIKVPAGVSPGEASPARSLHLSTVSSSVLKVLISLPLLIRALIYPRGAPPHELT